MQAFLVIVAYIVSLVWTGNIAWNWVEPVSFFGFVGFLILWSILEGIAHMIIGFIFSALDF